MRSPLFRLAVVLLSGTAAACASSGAAPRPFPRPGAGGVERPAIHSGEMAGEAIISTALSMRGVPYRNGGADPSGFDCSGLVWYAFERHGIEVPRTVAEQFSAGRPVKAGNLEPGDLVFFETSGHKASHVGLFVGAGEFVHAPSTRGEVRIEHLSSPYWSRRYVGARRY